MFGLGERRKTGKWQNICVGTQRLLSRICYSVMYNASSDSTGLLCQIFLYYIILYFLYYWCTYTNFRTCFRKYRYDFRTSSRRYQKCSITTTGLLQAPSFTMVLTQHIVDINKNKIIHDYGSKETLHRPHRPHWPTVASSRIPSRRRSSAVQYFISINDQSRIISRLSLRRLRSSIWRRHDRMDCHWKFHRPTGRTHYPPTHRLLTNDPRAAPPAAPTQRPSTPDPVFG